MDGMDNDGYVDYVLAHRFDDWYWPAHGGYRPNMHRKGPAEGWSLCGRSRLGKPVLESKPSSRHPRHDGFKCEACVRLGGAQ